MLHNKSLLRYATRIWVPLVVVIAVLLGGVAVTRLRAVFGSESIFSATGNDAAPLTPSHVKTVTYDLDGPSQAAGTVAYLDEKAQPGQSSFARLPWHLTIATTQPVVIANLVAQSDADHLHCRITVNGVVEDQQSSNGQHAQAFCLVKAA